MVGRWREKLSEIVRGGVEGRDGPSVIRAATDGHSSRRARALRELGARDHRVQDQLLKGLQDPVPGVRRAAAWALGWRMGADDGPGLLAAANKEVCDAPRWTMAVAAVRCGALASEAWPLVAGPARRQLQTWCGARAPGPLVGAGIADMEMLWISALCPGAVSPDQLEPVDPHAARAGARQRVESDPDDRQALMDLAVYEHPDDYEVLLAATRSQGRRMRHTGAGALGLNGDPRGIEALLQVLAAIDVDPGHGFTGRATAATALGRLGLPAAVRPLLRAMRDEALDHEGRPGAGLGIQKPVRVFMLHALGELGDKSAAGPVSAYLGNTTGSPSGGYYLPAMDALVKLNAVSQARVLLGAEETTAANALGVLGALEELETVARYRGDGRQRVAEVAASILDGAR